MINARFLGSEKKDQLSSSDIGKHNSCRSVKTLIGTLDVSDPNHSGLQVRLGKGQNMSVAADTLRRISPPTN